MCGGGRLPLQSASYAPQKGTSIFDQSGARTGKVQPRFLDAGT